MDFQKDISKECHAKELYSYLINDKILLAELREGN